jgi:hypothetical protein
MPDNADMKIIIHKELIKVLQKIQTSSKNTDEASGECSSTPNIRGIHLQPCDESHETFTTYLQRLDNYLEIRSLNSSTPETNNQKVKILINCLRPKTYNTLTSLTAPDLPSKKPFETLTKLLQDQLMKLAKVVELALAIETAKLKIGQIQNPRSETNVHQVSTRSEPSVQRSKRNKKFVKH